jgi:hypothetical protein
MTAHYDNGRTYYRCRGGDSPDRCPVRMVREDALLPWARAVMEWLDTQAPARFAERASEMGVRSEDDAAAALANVEDSLRRADFMFYTAKRWTEDHYLAEVARLAAIRDELAEAVAPSKPAMDFTGILAAWDGGDPDSRRQLLGYVFDVLDVEDGQVTAYVPRADRATEVMALFASAWQVRSERDSNPRGLGGPCGFQDRSDQPLRHRSAPPQFAMRRKPPVHRPRRQASVYSTTLRGEVAEWPKAPAC